MWNVSLFNEILKKKQTIRTIKIVKLLKKKPPFFIPKKEKINSVL